MFGSLDGCFYLYVRFFLIYLFLQSRQLGLQHLILGFELIDLLGLCLTAPIFLAFVVYGKGIFVLGGVVECGRAGRLQFYPQLSVYFFELGDVELAGFDSECERIVIFLFIEHICQYEVSFIGLWRLFSCVCGGRFVLECLQIVRWEDVYVARYFSLFEGSQQKWPKLLEIQWMACFGGNLHDWFGREDALPLADAKFLGEEDADVTVHCESYWVVAADAWVRKGFLYIHIFISFDTGWGERPLRNQMKIKV